MYLYFSIYADICQLLYLLKKNPGTGGLCSFETAISFALYEVFMGLENNLQNITIGIIILLCFHNGNVFSERILISLKIIGR